jgi:hypothetical protein
MISTSKVLFMTTAEGNSFAILMWSVVFGAFTPTAPLGAILDPTLVHFFRTTSTAATQIADFSEAEESTDSDDNDDLLSW